jgi:N-acetyl-alpha-D-muramate 1-phosphate uridylyltransferase
MAKVMIFAAGLGKRLGNITNNIPKALVDINGKTALEIVVERCAAHGFNDIIINVHHFADMVEDEAARLNKKGYMITVSDERKLLLETGGGLFNARWFFDDKPFLLYNVDIMTDLDLSSFYRFHIKNHSLVTLAARSRGGDRFFLVDKKGQVHGWCNKVTGEQVLAVRTADELTEIAFSGVHVVAPEIFNYMNEGVYSLTTLYLQLASDHKILTFRHDEGYWVDIGTPEDLEYLRKIFDKQ